MTHGALAVPLLLLATACSTPAIEGVTSVDLEGGDSSEVSSGGAEETGQGEVGETSDPGGTTGDEPHEESSSDGGDSGAPPVPGEAKPCPDDLPESWLFCEDFEAITDPAATFFEYQDADGAFVLDESGGASGVRAMKATYTEGNEGAGWLSVAFGANPIVYGNSPQVAGDQNFQSIYWRLRVKMEDGWPDVGPGQLTSATSFASADWQQALVARLRSDGDDVVLLAEPISCIEGGAIACAGFDDVGRQKELGGLAGAMPLFSAEQSGKWHCVEAHVALNNPGVPDGVFEFWVDGELQNESHELDWRGTWVDYGINLVTVQNLWHGGAPKQLSRWIDDLVISTEPIGCD